MLHKSRELTQKAVAVSDSEEEEEEEDDLEEEMIERQLSSMSSNPWMKVQAPNTAKSEFSRPEVVLNSEGQEEVEESEGTSDEDEDVLMKMGKELKKKQEKVEETIHSSEEEVEESGEMPVEVHQKEQEVVFDHSNLGQTKNFRNLEKQKKKKEKGMKKAKENIDEIFQKLEDKAEDEGKKENSKSRKRKIRRMKKKMAEEKEEDMDDTPLISEGLRRKKTLEEIEEDGEDTEEEVALSSRSSRKLITQRDSEITSTLQNGQSQEAKEEVFVDPKKLFTLETKISNIANPDVTGQNMEEEEEEENGEEALRSIIAQAFADDDVIDEFVKEKKSIIDRDKPTDIDLFLPGWGCWGGEGVRVSKKKRKK